MAVSFWGLFLSFAIESLQFVLKKGLAETDDIIHNTLGCLIGYGIYTLFYELIQVALDTRDELSQIPSNQEWDAIFAMSKKQAVTGVAFLSLDKLSRNGTKPPIQLLYEWIGLSEQIKAQNDLLEKRILEVTNLFENAGFQSCILKGQGNDRMYPVPTSRIPGDIDLWVFAKRNEINQFVKERYPEAFEQYHHIDFPIFKDVEVEVHYMPGQLLSPKYDKRFQDWCNKQISNLTISNNLYGFKVPSIGFNAVFQMVHMMVHFFHRGNRLETFYRLLLCISFSP